MDILSDCVINPVFNSEEIEEQIETANFEIENMLSKPDVLMREVNFVFSYFTMLGCGEYSILYQPSGYYVTASLG